MSIEYPSYPTEEPDHFPLSALLVIRVEGPTGEIIRLVLDYVLKHLDAYLFFFVLILLLLFLLGFVLFLAATALEPHARSVAQLVIKGHLGRFRGALTSLATLAALGTLALNLLLRRPLHILLVVCEETIVINFVKFYFCKVFLQVTWLESS